MLSGRYGPHRDLPHFFPLSVNHADRGHRAAFFPPIIDSDHPVCLAYHITVALHIDIRPGVIGMGAEGTVVLRQPKINDLDFSLAASFQCCGIVLAQQVKRQRPVFHTGSRRTYLFPDIPPAGRRDRQVPG